MAQEYGNPFPVHPRMRPFIEIIDWLMEAAAESARRTAGQLKRRPPKRGLTLQPGPDTPLWNELVRQVAPLLRKRGSKVHLARILGIPKQRLNVCLKARVGALDAERTLLLLAWLAARRSGRELV
jgi:hypothetical protein